MPVANTHVGTIHTVRGREADTVIFVLGAPKAPKTVRGSGPQAPRTFSMWPCHELNRTCTLSNRVELGRVLVMLANSHNQCRASGCDDLADARVTGWYAGRYCRWSTDRSAGTGCAVLGKRHWHRLGY
jgi:hypothetical protein